jgi:succinate dehydrogenase / fumarate reductase flavoprotein subunit
LGGNSLSDLLVFGKRAGEHAATYAKENRGTNLDEEQIKNEAKKALEPFARVEGESAFHIQNDLQEMMQELVGIVRNEEELLRAAEHLKMMYQRAAGVRVTGNREYNPGWHTALDLQHLLTVSEAITMAAIERKESRGAHFREDYPQKDEQSGKFNLIVKKNTNGDMELRRDPIKDLRPDLRQIIEEMK